MAPGTVVIAASVICIGLVLVMVRLTYHFAAPPISVTAEWLEELSVETTALLHLVCETDFESLRMHLPKLKSDFKLISRAVKVIIVQSKRDRPDLVRALVRNQMTFAYRMMTVRFRFAWRRFR